MSTETLIRADLTLEQRYTEQAGPVMLGGVQALVRLMLDQRRLDQRRGLDTGIFVSGYQGSPLGGLDQELARTRALLDPAGIVFHAGLNEELAATAVGGTQLLGQLAGARKQGVTGFWYGKSPGLDRAADAIRHSNLSGTAPLGGAVALIGDDPASKSSTVPSSSEPLCRSLVVPLLAPGNVQEVLTLGLHAVALSRHAGTWSALKIVADLADSAGIAEPQVALAAVAQLAPRAEHDPPVLLPPFNLAAEQDLFTTRLQRVHEYARLVGLNRVCFAPRRPRIGIVASGVGYQAVLRALAELGLHERELEAIGVRLISLSMPWPLEDAELLEMTRDLYTVLVVEDKLPFVEARLKEALYREASAPLVLGKHDQEGRPLLPVNGTVSADEVAFALARVLPDEWVPEDARARLRRALELAPGGPGAALEQVVQSAARRTPYFCSGCPHNISTRAGADQLVGVGIGCHTMVALDRDERRGHLLGMPQMGGEGAQWFGLAQFTAEPHFIQNMGDGTFHHSGSLAIRAAVAAGVNITYRLLYNDAVAMTGGQAPEGRLSVPELISLLAREGVRQVIVTTPEPERYRGVTLDPIASVRHRDEYDAAQAQLAALRGVTVLLHDDRCATEKRRLRKRGKLETPPQHAFINERVCEGCGDCGEQSSCLSLLPTRTEFGRKTRIQQSSCNQDMSCLKGDCPSFVLVTPARRARAAAAARSESFPAPPATLPAVSPRVGQELLIRMPGVGGTGVVTTAAILRMAAFLQGLHAAGLDQTGLAQKGGPVISDLRISAQPIDAQVRATRGAVDVLLGFDLLGCVDPATLSTLDPARTIAVLNSDITPTAANVTDVGVPLPVSARLIGHLRQATRSTDVALLAAQTLSERLFGDHMQANMLLVGAAFQHGCLPLEAVAIERAIELNGAAVKSNLAAFRWGRAAIADPAALERALAPQAQAQAQAPAAHDLQSLLELHVSELTAYQDAAYAQRYLADVRGVEATAGERLGDAQATRELTEAYARGLFKLMAYKDEYEVARLHLDPAERARIREQVGGRYRAQVLLHPPLLRSLGVQRKLRFGVSATPLFHALHAGRRLRGTALDPFARSEVRRVERELIDEYRALVATALARLDLGRYDTALEIAGLPDMVRGYEQIKLDNVSRMRARAAELVAALDRAPAAAPAVLEVTLVGATERTGA